MNRKFNVIRINGLKGIFIAVFIIGCLIAGFLVFPGWVCKGLWNFAASYFTQMPQMSMLHGIMLWCIIALSVYALNQGNFAISIGHTVPMPRNEERIKEILKQLNEANTAVLKPENRIHDDGENFDSHNSENNDRITK